MSWLDNREQEQLEFLGLAISTMDQRRRKAAKILMGLIGLLWAYMAGVYFEQQWTVVQTRRQVEQWAQRLAQETTVRESYDPDGDSLPEPDQWGRLLRVVCKEAGNYQIVIVSSDGPDKWFGTDDDITAHARTKRPPR